MPPAWCSTGCRRTRTPQRWRTRASSRAICVAPFTSTSSDRATDDPFWVRLVGEFGLDGAPGAADAAATLPADYVRRVAAALQPGRSALLALTNGIDIDPLLENLGQHERLIRCDLGDGGAEALRERIAPRADEAPVWPQSGFGSFQ